MRKTFALMLFLSILALQVFASTDEVKDINSITVNGEIGQSTYIKLFEDYAFMWDGNPYGIVFGLGSKGGYTTTGIGQRFAKWTYLTNFANSSVSFSHDGLVSVSDQRYVIPYVLSVQSGQGSIVSEASSGSGLSISFDSAARCSDYGLYALLELDNFDLFEGGYPEGEYSSTIVVEVTV